MKKFFIFLMSALIALCALATDYPGHPGFVGKTVYVDEQGFPVGDPGEHHSGDFKFAFCFEYGFIEGEDMPVAIIKKTQYESEDGLFQLPTLYSVWDEELNSTLWIKIIGIDADQLFWNNLNSDLVTRVEMPMNLEFITGNGALSFPNITSLTLPETLEYMDVNALNLCTSLTELTIADSDKPLHILGTHNTMYGTIGAFGVPALEKAYIGKNVIADVSPFKRIGDPSLKHVTLGGYGQAISDEMFYNQKLLETVILKEGVGDIGTRAFANCVKLQGISIPGTTESIARSAFENDSTMTTLTLGEGIKAIDYDAFLRCKSVKSITLPASLDSISSSAFTVMSGVTSFTIADGDTPLKVYGTRYYSNGLCQDFAPYVGHLGRDLTLTQGAPSPFSHARNDVGGLTKLTIGNKVTSLPDEAFCENRNLTTATIGTGLTAIPKQAFVNCVKLTGISIPGNVKSIGQSAFENDSTMTTLTLGEGIKAIGYNAFLRCSKVKSITLPASLDSIHADALSSMSAVTSFSIADGNTPLKVYGARYWGNGMCNDFAPYEGHLGRDLTLTQGAPSPFSHARNDVGGLTKLTIGNKVTSLPDEAFCENRNLTTATIGTGLTAIPKQAFVNCVKLTGISIPGNVKSIGQSAFENDSTMTTLTLGEGIKAIGYNAFLRCSKVKSITLPASLDSIHADALSSMSAVTSFSIADGNTPLKVYGARYWGNGMCNDFAPYEGHLGRDLTLTQNAISPFSHASNNKGGLTKLTIGNQVTTLPEYAFNDNRNLATATIGTGLTAIPKQAFINCVKLNGISIPGNVKSIGQSAFENDSSMTTLTLGEGIKAIDRFAFTRCSKVKSITLPASLDSIHADALSFMNGVTSFTIADSNKPLKVYSMRYWNNGMCNDFAPYEGYLGRDLTLTQNAISPFSHASNDTGGLTKLTIGDQVTTLPNNALSNNRNLTDATIGTGMTSILEDAFYYCRGLRNLTCNAVEPPVCASNAFNQVNIENVRLTVPTASKNKYRNAPVWELFFDGFEPGDTNGDGVVSGADVTALYNYLLDGVALNGDGDVNGDGVISGADVTALYNLLLGD